MDLASYLQGAWSGFGDDMRRQAGQSNAQNMREGVPTLVTAASFLGPRIGRPTARSTARTDRDARVEAGQRQFHETGPASSSSNWREHMQATQQAMDYAPITPWSMAHGDVPGPYHNAVRQFAAAVPPASAMRRVSDNHPQPAIQERHAPSMAGNWEILRNKLNAAAPISAGGLSAYIQSQPEGFY